MGTSDTLSGGTFAFTDANAGTGNKTVTVSGVTVNDGNSGNNYTVTYASNTISTINKATLSVTGTKIYDGSTSMLGYLALSGFVGSETVGYSAATVSDSHVATANKYVNSITLSNGDNGGLAGNYQIGGSYNASTNHVTINAATLTPTISNTGVTKVYDGNTTSTIAPTYTFSGLVGSDSAATLTVTGTKIYNSKDVAAANTVTVSGLQISGITGGGAASDYVLDSTSKTVAATVTAAPITITAVNINDKVYDGTTTATVVQSTTFTGRQGSDDVNVSGTLGDFSSANVGTYSVSITGTTLTGTQASNYTLTGGTTFTDSSVAITPRTVTLSATKVYDGTAAMSSYLTINTGVAGEALNFTGSANANSAHVASAGYIASGVTLSDGTGLASNYQLPSLVAAGANNTVTITPATLTSTITNTGVTKVYDGNTSTTLTPTYSFTGLVAGDTGAVLTNTSKTYNSKDVLAAAMVTVDGLAIASVGGSNSSVASDYVLDSTSKTVSATITPKTLTVSGLAASNKVYDGYTTATVTDWGSVTTGVGTETVALNTGTAAFASADKANGITVTASGYSLGNGTNGGLLSNYQLSSTSATTTADITARTLTLSGSTGVTKVYDGLTSMALGTSGYGAMGNAVMGDDVYIAGAPVFNSATVAGASSILQGSVALAGTKASNYTLSWTNGTGASITRARLTISVNNDAKFVTQGDGGGYNGVSYSGLVNGETNSVLTAQPVISRTNGSINGAGTYTGVLDASATAAAVNYSISYVAGDYTIVPAGQLLVTVQNASTTYGTGASYTITSAKYMDNGNVIHTLAAPTQNANTFTYSDGVGGTAAFTLDALAPQFSTANQLKAGNYDIGASNVTESSANFSNNLVVVGGLTVNQKALTANASNVSKVYDGTTSMNNIVLGFTGLVNGDVVGISGNGNFSGKNVGTNKAYTVDSLTLGSADAANYYLSGGNSFSGNNGEITKKTVSISSTRTYNGSTSLNSSAVTISTGVGSETLTYSGATAHSKNAGADNYIDAISLLDASDASGGLASNYQLPSLASANSENAVNFAQKALSISGITAANKVYDGNAIAAVNVGNVVETGLVAGDVVNVATTGLFNDKNVANGKTVTLSTSYTGADVGNYSITDQATTTADVTPKALTLSSVSAADKIYNGTVEAILTVGSLTGLVSGEKLAFNSTGTFSDANVGIGKTVTVSTVLSDDTALASNYSIENTTTTATINPVPNVVPPLPPSTPSNPGGSGQNGTPSNGPGSPTTVTNPDGGTTTTTTGPDGTTTQSTTTPNGNGGSTTETTTTNPDGSTSTSTTVTNPNGGSTTTTTGSDGTTTQSTTTPNGNGGSTTETSTKNPDGSASTNTTTRNPDGSSTSTTTARDGSTATVTSSGDVGKVGVTLQDGTRAQTTLSADGSSQTDIVGQDGRRISVSVSADGQVQTSVVDAEGKQVDSSREKLDLSVLPTIELAIKLTALQTASGSVRLLDEIRDSYPDVVTVLSVSGPNGAALPKGVSYDRPLGVLKIAGWTTWDSERQPVYAVVIDRNGALVVVRVRKAIPVK